MLMLNSDGSSHGLTAPLVLCLSRTITYYRVLCFFWQMCEPRISLNLYKAKNIMGQCINCVNNGGGRIEVKCWGIKEIA